MQTDTTVPSAATFTTAPLRNRILVALDASVPKVWALVGDPSRLPEYSAGLERVDVKTTASGAPAEYLCHFKPVGDGRPGIVSRDIIRWHEENRGWASVGEEPNDFGITGSLHVVTLSTTDEGTLLKWEAHYDAADLDMNRAELDKALDDIATRLIARFGGRVVERYVEGSPYRKPLE